jgi:uncharacterized membrane protein YedE/YeeE
MKNYLSVFISGILFGMGLAISGMINPQKVTDFLDIAGTWDPTLLFVMGGAIGITMPGFYYLAKRRSAPLFSSIFYLPSKQDLDLPLIIGAVIFGIGWGLAGYCPGPAITSLVSLRFEPLIFIVALVIGQTLAKVTLRKG